MTEFSLTLYRLETVLTTFLSQMRRAEALDALYRAKTKDGPR